MRNWTSGGNTPSGRNRDRLLELHYVTQALRDIYTREGAEISLHGRKRSLAGRRPVDLLARAPTRKCSTPSSANTRGPCEAPRPARRDLWPRPDPSTGNIRATDVATLGGAKGQRCRRTLGCETRLRGPVPRTPTQQRRDRGLPAPGRRRARRAPSYSRRVSSSGAS